MKNLKRLAVVVLLLVCNFGLSCFVHVGWTFSVLAVSIIILVWRDLQDTILTVILPFALLVDFISPSHFPVLTLVSLVTWLIISVLQKKWLTNHSIASLIGMAFVGVVVYKVMFAISIVFANVLNLSRNTLSLVWDTKSVAIVSFVEFLVIILFGVMINRWKKFFGTKFMYGSR